MKFLTFLGKVIILGTSMLAAILFAIIMNLKISGMTSLKRFDLFLLRAESIVGAIVIGIIITLILFTIAIRTASTKELDSRTIYQNDQDVEVYVVTYQDEKIFTDSQLTSKIVSTSGRLHLKKDGVSISQSIDKIEYIGPNQKGSIVEKIEYSEKIYGESLFDLKLLNDVKSSRLKIYLKDPKSEKSTRQTEEFLKSFLYGTKGEN